MEPIEKDGIIIHRDRNGEAWLFEDSRSTSQEKTESIKKLIKDINFNEVESPLQTLKRLTNYEDN